jgi:ubiquinone/menaquinone biosynthesis C-methylase UbiE
VKSLLDYARTKAPRYDFILHRELTIPQPDQSADMVSAFSVFTHLLHAESYLYLEECVRILKPRGKVVFSFLEFAEPAHWEVFLQTKKMTQDKTLDHLNMFIERNAIQVWAAKLGVTVERFIDGNAAEWSGHALGQAIAVLSKPPA